MAKIAIKNMTEPQARIESRRIDIRMEELWRQSYAIDERANRLDKLADGWIKRSDRILKQLNDIASGKAVASGETRTLVEALETCSARYSKRIQDRNAVYQEKDTVFKEMDRLRKRQGRVIDRRWQLYGPRDPLKIHRLPL